MNNLNIGNYYFFQIIIPSFTNLRARTRFFFAIFFAIVYIITLSINRIEKLGKKKLYYAIFTIIVIESQISQIYCSNFEEEKKEIEKYKNLILKNGKKDSIFLFAIKSNKLKESPNNYIKNANF